MKSKELTDRFQDWQKRATDTARQMGQATHEYVHENAWTTIAFAAVIGAIVGYLLAPRED
jgi:ElaB/YqjD/DUF883 family membrane-anchored ribosome-binding protein